MNKEYFLRELEYLLSDLSEEERTEALQYYRDYFEEAGPEHEAEVLAHIGSPEKVAAELKNALAGDQDGGEYTGRGYYDERFDEYRKMPDRYTQVQRQERRSGGNDRKNVLLILLLLLIFGIPLGASILGAGFSLVAAVAGCLFGAAVGLLGLLVSGAALVVALTAAGLCMIIAGIRNMTVPAIGLMGVCLGFLSLSAALLLAALTKWGFFTVMPGLFRFCTEAVRKIAGLLSRAVHRMFGRGGASA